LLLGNSLRKEVRPRLAAHNISFSNVLFVTEESLQESELKAASFFWSIKKVKLPQVNEKRLKTVSKHLIDSVAPEHVFLKVEAWKMTARLSVIADLDMMVLNPAALANCLMDYLDNGKHGKKLVEAGTAVMQRRNSQVNFEAEPMIKQVRHTGSCGNQMHRQPETLSYCFAFIRPTIALAQRYEEAMQQCGTQKSTLSDQDLLSEVLESKHLQMPHTYVMFPSWWNHGDCAWQRVPEIMYELKVDKIRQVTSVDIADFVNRFGAAHFSKGFALTGENQTPKERRAFLLLISKMSEQHKLAWYKGEWVTNGDFLDYFLMPVWKNLKTLFKEKQKTLHTEIVRSIGGEVPGLGLSEALVTLSMALQEWGEPTTGWSTSSSSTSAAGPQHEPPWKMRK
jgi:hypothetical protein